MAAKGPSHLRIVSSPEPADAQEEYALKPKGGGGTYGGMGNDDLKPRVDFLHSAFLWLAGIGVTAFLALIGIILSTTGTLSGKIDSLGDRLGKVDVTVGQLQTKVGEMDRRFDRMDGKLDDLLRRTPARP